MVGNINQKELFGRSETRYGFSFCRFAFKEPAHPGRNVENVVRSIAFDNTKGYRLRRGIHLWWSSWCRNRVKSPRESI